MKQAASVELRVLLACIAAVGTLIAGFLWGLFVELQYNPWTCVAAVVFSIPPAAAVWLYYKLKRAEPPKPPRGTELFPEPGPPAAAPAVESPDKLLARMVKDAGGGEKAKADLQAFLDECRGSGMDDGDASEALVAFARGYFGPALPPAPPFTWVHVFKLLCLFFAPFVLTGAIVVLALTRPEWLFGCGDRSSGWIMRALGPVLGIFLVLSFVCWLRSASARRKRLSGFVRFFGNSAIAALVTMAVSLVLPGLQGNGVLRLAGRLPSAEVCIVVAGICWTYLSLLFLLLPRRVLLDDPFFSGILRFLRVKSFVGLRLAAVVFLLVPAAGLYVYLACG